MRNVILEGDSLAVLRALPSESIDCVMTSPPYWGLRDYGVNDQLGLEPTFQEYITKLCDTFDEIKRVLKEEGTCWVNLGDTYLPGKSLAQIPSRFSIEMINRGWILRNTIIWYKPNCMPSPAKDRFTVDFEYVFFFSKSKKYYFETQYEPHKRGTPQAERDYQRMMKGREEFKGEREGIKKETLAQNSFVAGNPLGRNKRTVWRISPKPFPEAHFAVYPEELCETPIRAGCPKGGIVLDPFFGSGTTGLVALKQGKDFIGIELNKEYIQIAEKRLRPYLSQTGLGEF